MQTIVNVYVKASEEGYTAVIDNGPEPVFGFADGFDEAVEDVLREFDRKYMFTLLGDAAYDEATGEHTLTYLRTNQLVA